jgi:hypothetical protein
VIATPHLFHHFQQLVALFFVDISMVEFGVLLKERPKRLCS